MGTDAPQPPATLALTLTSDPAELPAARKAVEAFANAAGFDAKSVGDIGLCVNEALANIIRHAYNGAPARPIELSARLDAAALDIHLRDWGNGVDPSPKLGRPKDPLHPGGLGLVCLECLMDRVEYHPTANGMLLKLLKRR